VLEDQALKCAKARQERREQMKKEAVLKEQEDKSKEKADKSKEKEEKPKEKEEKPSEKTGKVVPVQDSFEKEMEKAIELSRAEFEKQGKRDMENAVEESLRQKLGKESEEDEIKKICKLSEGMNEVGVVMSKKKLHHLASRNRKANVGGSSKGVAG